MGLRSGVFLVLMVLLAVALPVTLIWQWPRLAGSGPTRVLARVGLFAFSQFVVLLAMLLLVNSYFVFYSSWSDFFGVTRGGVHIVSNSKVRGPQQGDPPARALLSGGPGEGELESADIHGLRSGLAERAYVYLPRQYFQPAYRTYRFPVVLDLTGDPDQARRQLPGFAAGEIAAGRIKPAIIVVLRPAPDSAPGADCTDIPAGAKAETFLAEDVPSVLRLAYRTSDEPRQWGAVGDGTGGYCALKLAMAHSDLLTTAASMGGANVPALSRPVNPRYADDQDLIWRLRNLPAPPVSVMVPATAGTFAGQVRPPMTVEVSNSTLLSRCLEWLSSAGA